MALIIGIVAVLIIIFGFLCYKKAPPTEAIVVTGFGLSSNIHIDGVELDEPKSHITSERVEDGWMFHEKDPITGEDKTSFRPDFTDEEKAIMDAHAKAAEKHATTNKTNPYKKKTGPNK